MTLVYMLLVWAVGFWSLMAIGADPFSVFGGYVVGCLAMLVMMTSSKNND